MRLCTRALVLFSIVLWSNVSNARLAAQVPSVKNFTSDGSPDVFMLSPQTTVIVDSSQAYTGSPSLLDFANTFRRDLADLTGYNIPDVVLQTPASANAFAYPSSIVLTLGTVSNLTYNNGAHSNEGYEINVTRHDVTISGAAPIGAWWGTRTLLQLVALTNYTSASTRSASIHIPVGSGADVPGWEIRGFMLDAGRHFFETTFLTDLCIYASFFKINEFHLHASDNLWNPDFLYGSGDSWKELYAGFRFQPSAGSPVSGLVPPAKRNETWTRVEFEAMQSTCALHGVALIPEIDTPGHSLVISQWKPELMIAGAPDDLNLSHPETIPTIRAIWGEFLPWMSSGEVSIGADEYEADLADDYIDFVNGMADYIHTQSGKSIRVWGTNEPSPTNLSIARNVTIQHWDFPGDTIPVSLMAHGYSVINSEQSFLYLDGKTSYYGQFPQELDQDLMWTGAPNCTGWAPNIFSPTDAANNTTPQNPLLRGAIMALWNDWGNNATTQLEIYYQLARSLAVFGEKTWAGSGVRDTELARDEFDTLYPVLNTAAPGQNLNRAVKPQHSNIVYSYDFRGQQGHGAVNTSVASVGPPYTLTLRVRPTSQDGVLMSGLDSALHVANLTFEVLGQRYGLDHSLPLNKTTTVTIHATREYTYAVIDDDEAHPLWWTTTMDIWGEYIAVGNMSFAAPAEIISGCVETAELTLGA